MRRIVLLVLIVLFLQSCDEGKDVIPPTDWQMNDVHGKVKIRKWITFLSLTGNSEYMVTHYDEKGFIESVYFSSIYNDKNNESVIKTGVLYYEQYKQNIRKSGYYDNDDQMIYLSTETWKSDKVLEVKKEYVNDEQYEIRFTLNDKGIIYLHEDVLQSQFRTLKKLTTERIHDKNGYQVGFVETDNITSESKKYRIDVINKDEFGNVLMAKCYMGKDVLFSKIEISYEYYDS